MYRKKKRLPGIPSFMVWFPRIYEIALPLNRSLGQVAVNATVCILRTLSNTDLYKVSKAYLIYVPFTDIYFLKRQSVIWQFTKQ